MSGPKDSDSLSPSQKAIIRQIVSYGRAKGFSDYQIHIAVKTAYIESSLGKKLGPNPESTASGLFGYTDGTWNHRYKIKNDNSNQIKAFFDDLAGYSWQYDHQPYGPIPTKDVSLAEYIYIKHHDGRNRTPSAHSVGKKIWDHETFDAPLDPVGPRSDADPRRAVPGTKNLLAPDTSESGLMPPFPSPYEPTFAGAGSPAIPDSPASLASPLPSFPRRNAFASSPVPFEETVGKSYAQSGQPQAGPAALPSEAGKPSYSLKDKLEFIGKVYPTAKALSDQTGLSLPFILGHAAHEVDCNKNQDYSGLRPDEQALRQGPTYAKNNTRYRAYPTYGESMKDYQTFLEGNPRYGKMFEPVTRASTDRLANAIRYAGYSDDPLYGMCIMTAAKSPLMKRALWQYDRWPPG